MLLYGVQVVYRNLSSLDLLLCTYPPTHHYPQKLERRTALLPLFDVTGKMKLPAVKDYILDMLEGGRKIIVFGHHVSVLNGLCEALDKKVGISVCTGTCEKELLTQHFILRTIPNLNISLGALRTYVDTNTHTCTHTLMVDPYQLLILHPPPSHNPPTPPTHRPSPTFVLTARPQLI